MGNYDEETFRKSLDRGDITIWNLETGELYEVNSIDENMLNKPTKRKRRSRNCRFRIKCI